MQKIIPEVDLSAARLGQKRVLASDCQQSVDGGAPALCLPQSPRNQRRRPERLRLCLALELIQTWDSRPRLLRVVIGPQNLPQEDPARALGSISTP